MCIEKLICKTKLICNGSSVVFSAVGHTSPQIQYVAVLVKSSDTFTLSLQQGSDVLASVTKQGTGDYEFVILKGFELASTGIYQLDISSGSLYEINLATICLCDPDEC